MNSPRLATPEEQAYCVHFGIAPHLAQKLAEMNTGATVWMFRKYACELRKALDAEAIDTVSGGYRLTEVGRAECRKAVVEFNQWIRGAA